MAAIDLIVLGLIKQKPQSAYELQKQVEYRCISRWVRISTPSIYKKVVQLEKNGYLQSKVVREGSMPEKSVYRLTEKGEGYFLDLMDKTAGEMVHVFLDFNAVIVNLDFVSPEKRRELLSGICAGICGLQEMLETRSSEGRQVPAAGQAIFRQQKAVAEVLQKWIREFQEECLGQEGLH